MKFYIAHALKLLTLLVTVLAAENALAHQHVVLSPQAELGQDAGLTVRVSQQYLEKIKENRNPNPLDEVILESCQGEICKPVLGDMSGQPVTALNPSRAAAWCKRMNCDTQNGYTKTLRLSPGKYKLTWNGIEMPLQLESGRDVLLPVTEIYLAETPGRFIRAQAFHDLLTNKSPLKGYTDKILPHGMPTLPDMIPLQRMPTPLKSLSVLIQNGPSLFVRSLCRAIETLGAEFDRARRVCREAQLAQVMSKAKLIDSLLSVSPGSAYRLNYPSFKGVPLVEIQSLSGLELFTNVDPILIDEPKDYTAPWNRLNEVIPAFENHHALRNFVLECHKPAEVTSVFCRPYKIERSESGSTFSAWSLYSAQVVTSIPGRFHVEYVNEDGTKAMQILDVSGTEKQIQLVAQ